MSSLVPAVAWRLNTSKPHNLDSLEQPAICRNLFKMSAISSRGQWVKISMRVYSSKTQHIYLWNIDIRTGRSCQCYDPRIYWWHRRLSKTTRSATSDNKSSHRQPRPQCTLFRSSINRNKDDQFSQGINPRTERCCQSDDPASTDGTTGCHKYNLRRHKWRHSRHTDSPIPSVHVQE